MKDRKQFVYEIKNLSFSYSNDVPILENISLQIPSQSLVAISGPSGSGKSTLLSILGLIEPMQKGEVLFLGEEISTMTEKRKNEIRKFELGFIFQQFHLIPVLSAEENVKYFLKQMKVPKKEVEERALAALDEVGLYEHRHKKPSQLSGGQKQRVAIARAVAKRPSVIIGDEPTASLDRGTSREIIDLLARLANEQKTSIVLATHDPMVQSYANVNIGLTV